METKLTVRVPRRLLENAKRFTRENNTTLTKLVSAYLENISAVQEPLADAPIVRHLTGILSSNASVSNYKTYLEEKYGGSYTVDSV